MKKIALVALILLVLSGCVASNTFDAEGSLKKMKQGDRK